MNSEKVKQLIERYLEGETTLREEKKLRVYFRREDIPAELQSYAGPFRYHDKMSKARPAFDPFLEINFNSEGQKSSDRSQSARRMSARVRWSLRIAAGILLLVIGFAAGHFLDIGKPVSTPQANPGKPQYSYQDPARAFTTTKKALKMVAVNLNTGKKEVQKLAEFNEVQKKVNSQ